MGLLETIRRNWLDMVASLERNVFLELQVQLRFMPRLKMGNETRFAQRHAALGFGNAQTLLAWRSKWAENHCSPKPSDSRGSIS